MQTVTMYMYFWALPSLFHSSIHINCFCICIIIFHRCTVFATSHNDTKHTPYSKTMMVMNDDIIIDYTMHNNNIMSLYIHVHDYYYTYMTQ